MTTPSVSEKALFKMRGTAYKNTKIKRLQTAKTNLQDKIKANPKNSKVSLWNKRVKEYEKSINNLKAGMPERFSGKELGTLVGVPNAGGR